MERSYANIWLHSMIMLAKMARLLRITIYCDTDVVLKLSSGLFKWWETNGVVASDNQTTHDSIVS